MLPQQDCIDSNHCHIPCDEDLANFFSVLRQDAAGRPIPLLPRRSNPGFSIIANAPVAAFTPVVQTDTEVERLCLAHLASTAKDASVVVTEVDTAGSDASEQDILIGETCLACTYQSHVCLEAVILSPWILTICLSAFVWALWPAPPGTPLLL